VEPRAILEVSEVNAKAGARAVRLRSSMLIGRSSECDLPLQDEDVSRKHCLVEIRDGEFYVRDLGSANGTFVNGKGVQVARLADGDAITVGSSRLVFWRSDEQSEPQPGGEHTIVAATHVAADEPPFRFVTAQSSPGQISNALEKFKLLYRTNEIISQFAEPDLLFARILEQLFEVLPVDSGAIMLGSDPDHMEVAAVRRRSQDATSSAALSRTVLRRVFAKREALLIRDAQADHRFNDAQSVMASGARSVICAPLVRGPRIVGIIQCASTSRAGAFTQDDLEVLAALGRQAAIGIDNIRLVQRLRAESEIRTNLARFLPRELVQEVVESRVPIGAGGSKCKLSVLFADLRGFTSLSERLDPSELIETMNGYFHRMVDAVFQHGGTLDKFIGDAVMAFWGAPLSRPDDAIRSIRCALEMQKQLRQLNETRRAAGRPPLEMGIGLHCGEAVVGNVGSDKRLEYTALGSTVNIAARIEDRSEPNTVLISEVLHDEVRGQVAGQWLDVTQLKGVSRPMRLFSVHGLTRG
jgi:adenylate cyclase